MSFELATFYKLDGQDEVEVMPVHFNPASLRITMNNQFGDDPPEQHCRETTSKLDVELVFDTTDTGIDVRFDTDLLEGLTRAGPPASAATGSNSGGSGGASGANAQPSLQVPIVIFRWGLSRYRGIVESLTQTLDFWSSDGVPLRATVQLSLKSASRSGYDFIAMSSLDNPTPPPNSVTPATTPASGTGATDAAQRAGNPRAGRMVAAMNGIEDMRAAAGASVGVSASVNLSAAASFKMSAGASAGIGIGASAGASAGAGAGAGFSAGATAAASAGAGLAASAGVGMSGGASAGAGFSFGASAGAGVSAAGFGVSANATSIGGSGGLLSAGVSASAGAFAGLGSSKMATSGASLDPNRLLPPAPPVLSSQSSFDVSGRAVGGPGGQVAASYRAQAGVVFS